MFDFFYTGMFKKDYKKLSNNPKVCKLIEDALTILAHKGCLNESKYKTHPLSGTYKYHFDSHIKPDLILVWKKSGKTIYLARICSHSEL